MKTTIVGMNSYWLCHLVVLCLIVGCGRQNGSRTHGVLVFAAASSQEAVQEICRQFELEQDTTVRISFAGSATLATQIINGAQPDLFLSASLNWSDELAKRNLIHKCRPGPGNRLVAVVLAKQKTKWQPRVIDDLADSRIRRIAIADPDSVPAGIYAKHALTKADIWNQLHRKLVYGTHVRQTLAHVESGAADIGIVYRTDAKISEAVVTLFELDIELTGPINYGVVLTKSGKSNPQAVKLFEFIGSESSREIFEKHGFLIKGNAD